MELEALVSYLYIVGGRMVGSMPPGALAVSAPRKAPRIRMGDTFFVLVVPLGELKAPADVYQSLAQKAADLYYETSGSITSGLRETLLKLNQAVFEQQRTRMQPFQVGVICLVMHEQEIYLARCGQMLALYHRGEETAIFPKDRSDYARSLSEALGLSLEPRIELNRYELEPGCRVVLADEAFMLVEEARLTGIFAETESLGDMLAPLGALAAGALAHAMVLQFVTEDTPTPPPPLLRTLPAPKSPEKPHAEPGLPLVAGRFQPRLSALRAVGGKTRRLGGRMLGGVGALGERIFPGEPQEGQKPLAWLSNLIVLLTVLVPLVVVVVVISLALSNTGATAFEQCRQEVLERQEAADTMRGSSGPMDEAQRAEAHAQWLLVRDEALSCERRNPGDEEMRRIAGDAQNELDFFEGAVRRELVAQRQYPPSSDLRGPISGNWIQLYTLDRENDRLYEDSLNPLTGDVTSVNDQPIIFLGQNVRGQVVGELVDIEWMDRGGMPTLSNVPVVMDSSGLLVAYSNTFNDYDVLPLVLPSNWNRPVAIAMFRLNLYVLDSGAGQVWRYVPSQGVYSEAPNEYFAGTFRPDLSRAVDLGIDSEGYLYILFADGQVEKYFGGEPSSDNFDYYQVPIGALQAGTSLYVDNNSVSRGLVISDPTNATLYTVSWGGTYNNGYRPLRRQDAFDQITSTLPNADLNRIYVLSGNMLYTMQYP